MALRAHVAFLATAIVIGGCRGPKANRESGGLHELHRLAGVGRLSIRLGDDATEALKTNPKEWVSGDVEFLGRRVENAGVRLKGNRSLRPFDKKPAFKLRLDKYRKGQTIDGAHTLILNNMVEDPTMMREYLGYRLYRAAGVKAPRVGYVEVFVNEAPYGLYALIEAVDRDFVDREFGPGSGVAYEGEYGCDIYPSDVVGFDREMGDKKRHHLAALAAAADRGIAALLYNDGHLIDRENFLGYLAVSAFIADFDGYRHAHNYRIHYNKRSKSWSFIPWGIDRAFKKDLGVYDSYGRAADLCFRDARCRLDFLRALSSVVTEFERLDFLSGVEVLNTITRQAAVRDKRKPYANEVMNKARKRLREFIKSRPAAMRLHFTCFNEEGEIDADNDGYGCLDCDDSRPNIFPGAPEQCDGVDRDCSGASDDASACACEKIEVGGVTFDLCPFPRSFADAEEFCQQRDAMLAAIQTSEENAAVYAAAMKLRSERWWVGLSDRGAEGAFLWSDGTPLTTHHWAKGEPDNSSCNQDCVVFGEKKNGRWYDTHCAQPRPFVCRRAEKGNSPPR